MDPLPYPIEAVYGRILKLPRIRFLIADDPGAGKTIMAGLIIKELKLRQLAKKILIVAPGHLKDQWRRELHDRFDENFTVIDRRFMNAFYGENAWIRENQAITSIDFAKKDDIRSSISTTRFDLVIVDEAHKMSAYRYGDKTEVTGRYKLGRVLSKITERLLFLTATPHKGDPDNFRLFLDLLEPGFFATNEMVEESLKNKDNPLFIRRVKEDLKDFDGKPLFLPRHVETVSFNLGAKSAGEKDLYNRLSEYVEVQYNRALTKDKRRNVAFALVILQRRLASSTYALLRSLERRKKRLKDLIKGAEDRSYRDENQKSVFDLEDLEDVEDLNEEERWKEEEIWETLSVAENREELEKEINTLDDLILRYKDIIQGEDELKLKELKRTLKDLGEKYPTKKDKKILIFTESRDTLDYLEDKIKGWGYSVNTIHGQMTLEERIKAESVFKDETQVMVATEAAGEGINLQFCHLMINYDIPWNPNRLDQRIGRIHRYGQQKEVYVFNLVAEDTREGKVLKQMFDKLNEIRRALGNNVFDVIGEVFQEKNLFQLLMEAAANARDIDDILKDLDIKIDEEYVNKVKENLGESLATRYIDYTRIREMAKRAREDRLIPEYTESFFKKAFLMAEGKIRELKDGFLAIDSIPYAIRRVADDDIFKKSYGWLQRKYRKITFGKEIAFKNPDATFVSFGHSLFEAVLIWIERNFQRAPLNGAIFLDPDGKLDGYILFYDGEIGDGNGEVAGRRLFAFYMGKDGREIDEVSPSIIWDLAGADIKGDAEGDERVSMDVEVLKRGVSNSVILKLEDYKREVSEERERQARIKEKYGVSSLKYLINKLDGELISYYDRRNRGENVDLVIRNKEERKEGYIRSLEELKREIEKEKSLTMDMPHFVGIIRVIPSKDRSMYSDAEVEGVGMRVAMDYEIKNGRAPEDVSAENLGFDIRSKDERGDYRYIEVKARAGSGGVALTQNEWFKARRFKDDYYLYVVLNASLNASAEPELYVIRNPAENLEAEEKVEIVRYLVPLEEIREKGRSGEKEDEDAQ